MHRDVILLVVGAFLGLFISIVWEKLKDILFWLRVSKKIIGKYDVILKSGNLYPDDKITWAEVKKAKYRTIYFEMEFESEEHKFGNSKGEVVFSTENYGRGWYQHEDKLHYGFIELFIMSETQIAVCRKFTTDDTHENKYKSVEVSFIWRRKEKQ